MTAPVTVRRSRGEKIYIAVSPLPALLLGATVVYLRTLEGWAQFYTGLGILLPIVGLSLAMCGAGLVLTVRAYQAGRPIGLLLAAAGLAGSLTLLFLIF